MEKQQTPILHYGDRLDTLPTEFEATSAYQRYLLVRYEAGEITRDQYIDANVLYMLDMADRSIRLLQAFEGRAHGTT